jgi:hypothetical protein
LRIADNTESNRKDEFSVKNVLVTILVIVIIALFFTFSYLILIFTLFTMGYFFTINISSIHASLDNLILVIGIVAMLFLFYFFSVQYLISNLNIKHELKKATKTVDNLPYHNLRPLLSVIKETYTSGDYKPTLTTLIYRNRVKFENDRISEMVLYNIDEFSPTLTEINTLTKLILTSDKALDFNGLENLSNLRFLELSSEQIFEIPSEIFELTNLEYLELRCPNITTIPDAIIGLQNLGTLELHAKLTTVPSNLKHLNKIEVLYIQFDNSFFSNPPGDVELISYIIDKVRLEQEQLRQLERATGKKFS